MNRETKLLKISETYIKFNFEFTENNKALIKEAYLEYVGRQSKDFLKNREEVIISIEYEKGSLKVRIIAWGAAIYVGVAAYGSFRSGIREMVNDSKDFSEFVHERIKDDPNIDENNIIRLQKRTGIPGRLNEIFIQVNSLQRNLNNFTPNQVQQQLNNIKQEISNISAILNQNDRAEFFNALPPNFSNNLLQPQEEKFEYLETRYGLKPNEDIEVLER
ncbi:MAG: hypothetical protein ACI9OE_001925 [Mariniflexile sp.]|jgi:hypothetical protein